MAQQTEAHHRIVNDDYPLSPESRDPLPFPEPRIDPCVRITTRIYDPFTRDEAMRYITVPNNVVVPTRPDDQTRRRLQSAHLCDIDWNPSDSTSSSVSMNPKPPLEREIDCNSFCHSSSSKSSDIILDSDEDMMDVKDDVSTNNTPTKGSTDILSQKQQRQLLVQQQDSSDLAYWLQRSLRDAIYGKVIYAIVLKRRSSCVPSSHHNPAQPWAEWEITSEKVAVKEMSWAKIKRYRRSHAEDPLKEVAAMQYLKRFYQQLYDPGINNHPETASSSSMAALLQAKALMIRTRLMMVLDVLSDGDYLYSIMPFCDGSELFDLLVDRERFTEGECRYWINQILVGIESLQVAGLCHRDMSLENLVTDASGRCIVIDMGMALRVPLKYNNNAFESCRNEERYLVSRQERCGKEKYMSPEIYEDADPFDGFTVDLWAVGVILFIMLTGVPPWKLPCRRTKPSFCSISHGYLQAFLRHCGITISCDAMDLLQRMLLINPQHRLSLDQIRAHPWMLLPMEPPPLDF